jgi:hypothetical protein
MINTRAVRYADADREAGVGGEGHQGIETEFADAAAQQIVQTRLRHTQACCRCTLRQMPCRHGSLIAIVRLERSFMFPPLPECLRAHPRHLEKSAR